MDFSSLANQILFGLFVAIMIVAYAYFRYIGTEFKTIVNWMTLIIGVYVAIYIIMQQIDYYKNIRPIITSPIVAANTGIRIHSDNFPTTNKGKGVTFSTSMWMYVNNIKFNGGVDKDILRKGKFRLYMDSNTNDLHLDIPVYPVMSSETTVDYTMERLTIEDFPLQKWVNVVITVDSRTVDVWLNGRLYRSIQLGNLVYFTIQDDVYFIANQDGSSTEKSKGGYDGFLSRVYYFNSALSRNEIQDIFNRGPYATTFLSQFGERLIQLVSNDIAMVRNESIVYKQGGQTSATRASGNTAVIQDIIRNNQAVLQLT